MAEPAEATLFHVISSAVVRSAAAVGDGGIVAAGAPPPGDSAALRPALAARFNIDSGVMPMIGLNRSRAKGSEMASLFKKASDFARSRKGRELTEKAKEMAKDPETRRKIEQLRSRASRKR